MASKTGLLPYAIEVVDDDAAVTAHAGLPLVIETMRKLGMSAKLDAELGIRRRNDGATDSAKAEAIVLLMAAGGDCISDIDFLRADKGLQRLIGAELPTQEVLRTFLYAFHSDKLINDAQRRRAPGDVAYIPAETSALQGVGRVNIALTHEVAHRMKVTSATLDHDATIQESHKRDAMAHYQGGRGYQPSMLYWVEADQILGDEYRDGNVPAAMANLPLLQKGFSGDWPKDARPLRYVAVKFIGRQLDLDGKLHVKHLAVVSNRRDMQAADLLTWHWQKAGTIEHVHDVIKNELGGATPPCGRFGANAAWFRFARLTYNVLSAMKQLALPPSMETARPKKLRFSLFSLPARITSHAGSLVMKLGRSAEQLADLVASRLRLAKLAPT